ncbi:MAG: toll/interleukin-1 receptor domain-containing protein [Chloroflexota bacterium]
METPFALVVFVIIILIIGLTVYLSRRSASETSQSKQNGSQTPPLGQSEPPIVMSPPPDDEFGGQSSSPTRSGEGLFEPPAPPPSVPAPSAVQPPAPQAPAPKPIAPPPPTGSFAPPVLEPAAEEKSVDAPAIPTEEVRFTAFYPKEATVETWYTLLVYAHIESALSKVQADAARFKAEMGDTPRQAQSSAPAKLARGTEITIVPEMDGVIFNPERITFKWVEDLHRADFRLKVAQALAGTAGAGTATIFVGPLIVATIKFGMLFDEMTSTAVMPVPDMPVIAKQTASTTATIYKAEQIFASYSHKDTDIVIACRDAYQALGYEVLIDIDDLRSGEDWNQALMQLIDRADIFQLFWSARSAESKYCRQEWEYALQKSKEKGAGFIRPVYWEKPFIMPPNELEPLHFAYVPLAKPTAP